MTLTSDTRMSSNMRRLRKGDRFYEDGTLWEITGQPEWVDGTDDYVRVPMIRVFDGKRSRRHVYRGDHRVKLV